MNPKLLFLTMCFAAGSSFAQLSCGLKQAAFVSAEELHYRVVYNWGLVWLESGHASFSAKSEIYQGKPAYHFRGMGGTYPKYDWFFKVNDLFESYVDSASFRPLKFMAEIHEGNKHDHHTYFFNASRGEAYTLITRGGRKPVLDTVKTASCTIDVLTAIYFARSLDFSKCAVNDTIGMSLLIDGKVYPIYVRYLGKDMLDLENLGRYRCVKFSPLLVEGSIFKKGEGMKVWVSDDDNKLPLYIETPIIVGTVKVTLRAYRNLKYPEKARD